MSAVSEKSQCSQHCVCKRKNGVLQYFNMKSIRYQSNVQGINRAEYLFQPEIQTRSHKFGPFFSHSEGRRSRECTLEQPVTISSVLADVSH